MLQFSRPTRSALPYALLFTVILVPPLAASCAHGAQTNPDDGGSGDLLASSGGSSGTGSSGTGSAGTGSVAGSGGGIVILPSDATCTKARPCDDFPMAPILDPNGMPSGDPSKLFGGAGTGSMQGGPCLAEPADGALFPKNWLRPRILWSSGSNSLFEVRVHADGERNDLVVYTTKTYWLFDRDIWQKIAYVPPQGGGFAKDGNLAGGSFTVTVRGVGSGGGTPTISNQATIKIAPALADGALVYWATKGFDNNAVNTNLQGFRVGDEGTTTALTSNQVAAQVRAVPAGGGNLTNNFQQVYCIGCHTATPDGNYVAFTAQWPWPNTLASIQAASAGAVPPWMSKGAIQNLSPDYGTWYNPPAVNQIMLGIGTFSPAHYVTGDRMYVATLGTSWNSFSITDPGVASGVTTQLAWFNLEWDNATTMAGGQIDSGLPVATPCTQGTYPGINGSPQSCLPMPTSDGGWGIIARQGDTNGAGAPSWSHNADGKTDVIAYASTNVGIKDGRMDCSVGSSCASDVYLVPYGSSGPGAGGKGGNAVGLPGASDQAYNEYYPAWSPDDRLLAFNRVPAGTSMYNQPQADVYVVAYNGGMGGTPHRLVANDPVACTGAMPHTVQNTWPKWAPNPLDMAGKPISQKDTAGNTYYWVTFSSTRSPTAPMDPTNGNKRKQQLYVAGIVVDPAGTITSFAPIYLWNQDYTVNNLIPAWGEFSIPPGSVPPPMPTAM